MTVGRQPALLESELSGIHYCRLDAVLRKEALSQQELREKILIFRPIIDDSNPAQRADLALQPEFIPKHGEHRRLEIGVAGFPQRGFDLGTAGSLSIRQQSIQKGAARVRIDLDQPGSRCADMKVEAHEYAARAEIALREFRSPG